ncbi:MAG: cbb3-type cytochrome oxidase assembly protein CcoS [Phycisphaerales bacterium]
MSILFLALPVALLIAAAALGAFIWATRAGQFDDLDTPGYRAIFDDLEADSAEPDASASQEKTPPAPFPTRGALTRLDFVAKSLTGRARRGRGHGRDR